MKEAQPLLRQLDYRLGGENGWRAYVQNAYEEVYGWFGPGTKIRVLIRRRNQRNVMVHKFGLDLRVARKRAALTQADCAHMLGTDQPRVSKLEAGKALPSMVELSILYLIFDQSLGNTSAAIVASRRDDLLARLASIPDCPPMWRDRQTRFRTLGALAEKLADIDVEAYD